jgi:gliding motility-associated-like protein/uncharacterized repeat protein (TIGR02543 family)
MLLTGIGKAQIVINEFSAANKSSYAAANGNYYDWVELYNNSGAAVNISGWYLSDNPDTLTKWQIPNGITMANNSYRIFFCSGRNGLVSGQYHTSFKLTQSDTSEHIILTNPSLSIIDSLTIFPCDSNDSRGRVTNGASTWGIFTRPTPNASNNTQTAYPSYVPKVTFSLPAGFYTGTQSVTLSCSQPNTTIRYTTNGSTPTAASTAYATPISVSATTVIRAKAFDNSNATVPSFVETNTYFINENHTLPVVSVSATSLSNELTNGNLNLRYGNLEFFSSGNQQVFEIGGEFSPHGNDSWAYSQKGFDFDVEDQYGTGDLINKKMFYTSPRKKFKWLIFKAAGSDNFPDGGDNPPSRCAHIRDAYGQTLAEKYNMHLDVRRADHCLVFVNGQYWGVYEYREKVDEDYFDYYYDQQEEYVDNLKYWGGMDVDMGSDTAWTNLYNYVVANNMTVQANYQHVADRLDVMSLIDMVGLGLYTVNSDWLNWNTAWWRGRKGPNNVKWKYWLWDTDNTFDLGEDYTGWGNTSSTADPCDINSAGGGMFNDPGIGPEMGHIVIFNKLMTNPNFRALYVNRMADLLNGPFSCTNMLNHLDTMVARIQPEMQRQCTRWNGNYNTWLNNVQYLRTQISNRCVFYDNAFTGCYNVTGPYRLAVDVYPPNAGTVTIGNTITPTAYVYRSEYFGGVNISFKATADTGYVFSHWQTVNHTPLPSTTVDSMYFDMGTLPDSVVAVFIPTDSVDLTVYVNPVGAGNITVNGNTPATYPKVYRFPANTPLTISQAANAGFTFSNWLALHHTLNPNNTATNITFTITQDDTLIANYTAVADTHALTVLVNPAGGGNVSVNGTTPGSYPAVLQFADSTVLNVIATPTAGYTFTGWTILHHALAPNNTSANASFTITTGDTLLANFAAIPVTDTFTLTVLVTPAGGGNVSVNGTTPPVYPATLQFADSTVINLVATQNGGFTFTSYTLLHHSLTPNNTTANASFTITQNDTLLATFTPIPNPDTFNLTVLVTPAGGGNVSVNGTTPPVYPTTLQFVDGTPVNLAATQNGGFTFTSYTLLHHTLTPNNTTANASFNITQNDTLLATFTPIPNPDTFNLTVLVTPAGSGNVSVNGTTPPVYPTTLQFVDGTPVNLVATQNGGFTFTSYTLLHHALTPNSTTATASFNITQSDTLLATFIAVPDTFDLTVIVTPATGGNVTVDGTDYSPYPVTLRYPANTAISATAAANTGYTFTNWQLLNHTLAPNSTSATAGFTITQSDTLTAVFTINPPDSFDIVVDIEPNRSAGVVVVAGVTPTAYPYRARFAENTLVDFEATGTTITTNLQTHNYIFDRYDFIYHTPQPNENEPVVFIRVERPDTVIVWFKDKPAEVDSSLQVWIPSAFVPDGVNNIFRVHPRSELLADFNMQIYNRWGQKVFESNNQSYGWNGQFNGKEVALGVYSYIVKGLRQNGEDVLLRGTVTVVR